MKFVLVEAEIKQAIQEYVSKLITVAPGATIDIDVKATRGADGVTAEIDVALAGAHVPTPVATPVKATPAVQPAAVAPAVVEPAPVAPVAEPVPEQLATATAPAQEPELPNDDDAPLEPGNDAPPAEPIAGKSIFG